MAEELRPDWNSFARANASQRWRTSSAAMGADATRALVVEARISEGLAVLDVASGTGEPAISIATALNGTGHVVASDISEGPLKIARERAASRGLTNIEFEIADAMALPYDDATFDRATSRLGVMFFADAAKALREIHRVLKPEGQVSLLAWGSMEQPYFTSTIGMVRKMISGSVIPVSGAKMFKFGDPQTLRDQFSAAGFADIDVRAVELDWTWPGTPQDVWDYFQGVTVPFKPLLDSIPQARREEVDAAVVKEITRYSDGKSVKFGAQFVLASARP
jgi:ubiquinone/menaquinone biosynthesis C-methylase UbiE